MYYTHTYTLIAPHFTLGLLLKYHPQQNPPFLSSSLRFNLPFDTPFAVSLQARPFEETVCIQVFLCSITFVYHYYMKLKGTYFSLFLICILSLNTTKTFSCVCRY